MNSIKRINHHLETVERITLVAILSVIILLSFLQVILRQCFSTGLLWADTFLRHLVLWIGFLGAAVAVQQNKHFTIDAVRNLIPEKRRILAGIVTNLFAVICLSLLSHSALKFFKDDLETKSVLFTLGTLDVPAYYLDVIIPVGFILLTLHFLLKAVEKSQR